MGKKRNTGLILTIISILTVLGFLSWFLITIFESEKPGIQLEPIPNFLADKQDVTLFIKDMERGLKRVKVSMRQGDRNIVILDKTFPFKGLFNCEGTHRFETEFSINPSTLNLAQGRVDLQVHVWDYSRRNGGDGNLSTSEHKMVVDTISPAIRAVSRLHYVNRGGSGLVVYQTTSDSVKSGLFVNDHFFPGFPGTQESQEGMHVCYFGIPLDIKGNPEIYLWAEDKAGNRSKAKFYCRIRKKRFRTDRIKITDRFLKQIFPYFSFYLKESADKDIARFLKINQDLRRENQETFYNLRTKTSPTRLWDGVWLRLKNAANMARFGDKRAYFYKGKEIDEQVHMGVDLASLANSDVPAANNGRVIFAERLGIYGLTVVLDHGQGLASTYSHLSNIGVQLGQDVKKGEIIGSTGQTGLAGGDHLHLGVMISGLFVNPIEWWDNHWIQDNIMKKIAFLKP